MTERCVFSKNEVLFRCGQCGELFDFENDANNCEQLHRVH
jgi:hypothetical protein